MSAAQVSLTVLGPVEVLDDTGRPLPGLAPRHRAVLGYLLVNAGRVVSAERLIDAVWGVDAPETARAQIHAAVTAIRRVLRGGGAAELLETRPEGYVALARETERRRLDQTVFSAHVAEAQRVAADGRPDAAAAELRAGLALWRGEALGGVRAEYAADHRARLEEKRLSAFERLCEAELGLGRHEEVLDDLSAQAAAYPLRERLTAHLVLALHRAGRQADALTTARAYRAALAETQGLDPGRAFTALEAAVLRDDPSLHLPPARPAGDDGSPGVPGPRVARSAADGPAARSGETPTEAPTTSPHGSPGTGREAPGTQNPWPGTTAPGGAGAGTVDGGAGSPAHAPAPGATPGGSPGAGPTAPGPQSPWPGTTAPGGAGAGTVDGGTGSPAHALPSGATRSGPPANPRAAAPGAQSPGPGGAPHGGAAAEGRGRALRSDYLPYDLPDFTGREGELARLVDAAGGVVAIDGMAGIGKTTLAVHAAHALAGRYPDGQLFVDLQSDTAGRQPLPTEDALDLLLRQIGLPAERIPAGAQERGALWRAELAERRVVAVLDNAASAEQVRPLLPGSAGSLVLVTSRRRLVDLDGAAALSVDLFPAADAIGLFTSVVGERADAEPLAALDVLQLCGFLPLAVRIAAARLLHRPRWTVAYLADRLRDERRRLAELATADRGVAAAFTVSYEQLPSEQQRVFRLLGSAPGRDFDASAAAALARLPLPDAEDLLEDLLDAHMLVQHEAGRYTFHDLLREHARSTATGQDSEEAREAARDRLYAHYLRTAHAAVALLHPYGADRLPAPPSTDGDASDPASASASALADPRAARAWLDAERPNLVAVAADAAANGRPDQVVRLAATLRPYLDGNAHHTDGVTVHALALDCAERLGSPAAQTTALTDLSWAHWRLGAYQQAREDAEAASDLCAGLPDGGAYERSRALNTLGNVAFRHRELTRARACYEEALALARTAGNTVGEAHLLGNLAQVLERSDLCHEANDSFDAALALHRTLGNRLGEAGILNDLGLINARHGNLPVALEQHAQARDLYRTLGNLLGEAAARNGLGEAALAADAPDRAAEEHTAALLLAADARSRPERARAHAGLARAEQRRGRLAVAREHAGRAAELYEQLDVPEAADARAFRDTLGSD
ncbi:AfsR/SARP family transcriptional regulator [Streptacidiphilus anmyonensis]|uniref:AfsR/SARP family transcriptional regulator n=1 Tax=Streptacidiphilus anmyonensis TaxID=405782 RepID=UPI000694ABA2|nr:AfsR/SARP family transcriptional regulator [Streptacidiphilus anmyonensis]